MKKEKRLVAIILGLAMLFALSACNQGNPSTEDSADADGGAAASTTGDTIKIGYYGPFTGANSTTGIATFEGISIAIDEWNKNGGVLGKEIELVYYDDAGVTESAIKAVTRLIDSDNVVGIIGSQMSANIVATGDMIEASQIPEVSCGTSATWLDQGYTYLFRTVPENTTGTVALADAIEAVGTTKLAVLCSKDEASQGSCQQTLDALAASGKVEVTIQTECHEDDTDWTGQLSSMVATNPDGVYLSILGEYAGQVIKQLRSFGYTGYIFGHEVMSLNEIREIAGDGANGIIFFSTYCRPDTYEECTSEYEKHYWDLHMEMYDGAIPTNDNSYKGYDEANILLTAISDAGSTDGQAIRDALANISGLECLAGTANYANFDDGNGFEAMNIYIIDEGKIVLLDSYLK
jgi:branched-chain amino acid transport system substrate-binding protein